MAKNSTSSYDLISARFCAENTIAQDAKDALVAAVALRDRYNRGETIVQREVLEMLSLAQRIAGGDGYDEYAHTAALEAGNIVRAVRNALYSTDEHPRYVDDVATRAAKYAIVRSRANATGNARDRL